VIILTEAAIEHTKKSLAKREGGIGIRLGTRNSGCSGFAYVIEYVDKTPETPMLAFDNGGFQVFVDPKDYTHLDGMKLDYVKKGLNEGFEFVNPNEKGRCGCGESVSL
jgi:iron-sulfur cluster assembly protein